MAKKAAATAEANAAFMNGQPSAALSEVVGSNRFRAPRSRRNSGPHQEERSAGQEEQAHDQGRRRAEASVAGKATVNVQMTKAGQQTPE